MDSPSPAAGTAPPPASGPPAEPSGEAARILEQLAGALARICPGWLSEQRQDILHTAWVRVMESQRAAAPGRALNAVYLWKAAYSAMVDEIRRRRAGAQRSADLPNLDNVQAPHAQDPETRAGALETGRCIAACLQGLLPSRRRAVTLHLIGYSPAEACTLTGWGIKQTRNLIYRGLADMRTCLESKGVRP